MNIIELAKHVGGVADDQTVVLFHEELEAVARAIRAEALEDAKEIAKTIGGSFAEEFLAAIRNLKDKA